MVAILEGIPLIQLYESIDLHRNANCGFARAAKTFAVNYLLAFFENEKQRRRNAIPRHSLCRKPSRPSPMTVQKPTRYRPFATEPIDLF